MLSTVTNLRSTESLTNVSSSGSFRGMNENHEAQKSTIMKLLATLGFIAVIIIIAWLAVQIVQYMPKAFSSLASLADSVYNNEQRAQNFETSPSDRVVNSGESFTLTWNDMGADAGYAFRYACAEGIAISVRNSSGDIINVSCDTSLSLGSRTNLEAVIASERSRFADIQYTVSVFDTSSGDNLAEAMNKVTVVNASIPQSSQLAEEESEEEVEEEVVDETPEEVATPTPTPTTPPPPQFIEEEIFAIPVSDPNGFTDLAVRYIGVGVLGNNNIFVPQTIIDNDVRGAFQFEVKNVGTKTSESWQYTATLPSGASYESNNQVVLRPNERAIITLGFNLQGQTGVRGFGATVSGGADINTQNNAFAWSVNVVD